MGDARRRSEDPLDLTAAEAVLRVLAAADGPLSTLEIARSSSLSTLTVIPVLDRLVRQGAVTRSLTTTGPSRQQGWAYQLAPVRRSRTSPVPDGDRTPR